MLLTNTWYSCSVLPVEWILERQSWLNYGILKTLPSVLPVVSHYEQTLYLHHLCLAIMCKHDVFHKNGNT